MCRRVHHIVRPENDGHIGLTELAIDVLHLEHLVVRHFRFCQQHVHVSRHAACHGMDGVLDRDAVLDQLGREFLDGMLRPCHGQTVSLSLIHI